MHFGVSFLFIHSIDIWLNLFLPNKIFQIKLFSWKYEFFSCLIIRIIKYKLIKFSTFKEFLLENLNINRKDFFQIFCRLEILFGI